MLAKFIQLINNLKQTPHKLNQISLQIEASKILHAKLLSQNNLINQSEIYKNLQKAEFSVFSQWGDDGIIDFLAQYLEFEHSTFLEFGVENYAEANTRFLLMNRNWTGFVIDGSEKNISTIKNSELYWKHELTATCNFITKENINDIIKEHGFEQKIDLLHIDIDGNDYHIWEAIQCVSPTLVIMEYNSIFGSDKPWTIPYNPQFERGKAHYSHLYCGASLLSLCDLANEKGYVFIGTNSAGNNAYFVKKGKEKNLQTYTCETGFVASKFRESRDENGQLNFLAGQNRLQLLKGLPILNTRSKQIEEI
ncbi:MAG: hypothetical protein ACOVK9_01330 [Bacteroidia bacterium]